MQHTWKQLKPIVFWCNDPGYISIFWFCFRLISDFEGLSNHLQKLLKPYYKKDRLASHDLLNDIQRAFVKSKANILHENKSIKLNAMLVRQIINQGIKELIWSEGFNPGDTGDFEKYQA